MDWIRIIEIIENSLVQSGKNKADLPKVLGVRPQYLSDLRSGKSKNPGSDFTLALINKMGVDPGWLETGYGSPFVKPEARASLEYTPSSVSSGDYVIDTFKIPLLTRDQAMRFDPDKEIPERKAHSGDYPDLSLVPVPWRVMEYSTDLRAITVFDSRMFPVLKNGDIAIFEAGSRGNGIQVYRMGGKLHITYAGVEDNHFRLFSEKEKEIAFDGKTYFPIGCVRAVVSDLMGYDWPSTAKANTEIMLRSPSAASLLPTPVSAGDEKGSN
ncbi:MAG: helix-turn-helix domain-containing protein [Spirochaetaceae bacterium]|jgi:transcriptional regulator with XRE-family HTH domain|nr:helix-turn-helix domain-containing protein [Spirochaetaceae bacterium]